MSHSFDFDKLAELLAQLKTIPPDQLKTIPPDQLKTIPPDQLKTIPPDQLKTIPLEAHYDYGV